MAENCWEFLKCGREPGGLNVGEFGICPASIDRDVDGINNGKNGGRACWAITGTFCGGAAQGSFASKVGNCLNCKFYKKVQSEERPNFKTTSSILKSLKRI